MNPNPPTHGGAFLAYGMSGLTMLLWVACVLPAGPLTDPTLPEDLATPLYREAWLLVPALLLLIIGPVGVVLSTTRTGRLGVLALTDAFIAGYAGLGLWLSGRPHLDLSSWAHLGREGAFLDALLALLPALLVTLLLALSVLSLYETVRVLKRGAEVRVPPLLKGVRLAICTLVLIAPVWFLVQDGREMASLLVPFGLVAISTAGAVFARAPLSLRFTASLVHLALAIHVAVTLRWTIFDKAPPFASVTLIGWTTLGIAGGILALAVLQSLWLWGRRRTAREVVPPVAASVS